MSQKIVRWQNKYARYATRLATYQAAGKAMHASRVLLKMQRLAKKLAKKGVNVRGAVAGQVGGVPFRAVGALQVGPGTVRKTYQVQLSKGAIQYQAPSGRIITLGYTHAKAKKKFKTKRRRKRLTQRDRVIIAALSQNPQAAPSLLTLM